MISVFVFLHQARTYISADAGPRITVVLAGVGPLCDSLIVRDYVATFAADPDSDLRWMRTTSGDYAEDILSDFRTNADDRSGD